MKRAGGKRDEADIARIAEVMHEAMRAWQKANGQTPSPPWRRAPKWMKESSQTSVVWRIANPNASVSAQHEQWVEQKKADGWKFGKVKDAAKKTHPMMIPYAQLPEFEKRKDALVHAVVDALK
jgi:hypothetical protein